MTVAGLLAGLAVACAVLAAAEAWGLAGRRRGTAGRAGPRRRPVVVAAIAAARLVGRRPGAPTDLAGRLLAAGAPAWLGPGEVMALKLAAAAAGAGAALLAGPQVPGRLGALAPVAAPALGFVFPDLLLMRRSRARAREARAEAPELLDRIRMLADAGLPPAQALARAARAGDGPLATELRRAAAAARWGAPREDTWRRLGERLPIPETHALAAAVLRAERHGAPLGPAVAALAAGARAARATRVRDRAQRAAPKIQLVVALLLVPAVLLLVAAALLAGLR